MSAALIELDRAACLHQDGGTQEACESAQRAITALAAEYRTELVIGRTYELLDAIPATTRGAAARSARCLQDLVRELA